ncbi:MAG: glucosidase [Bacteroidota bacterium]
MDNNPELSRLRSALNNTGWKRWGPYLSERQWGTVREDYSKNSDAWNFVSHDIARSRAYRWGEDGIAGFSDNKQTMCFALSLWNGKDPILKERLYGLSNNEGNHGEDVKELYYYLDATPTASYLKMLYKYPQAKFPYEELVAENQKRNRLEREFEITDTSVFDKDEYFDVFIEYAKHAEEDILIKITVHNRSKKKAPLHLLPTLWFRNTWRWGYDGYRPNLRKTPQKDRIDIDYQGFPGYHLRYEGGAKPLFCENDTNRELLYNQPNLVKYTKDGINDFVVNGAVDAVNPDLEGTKCALHYNFDIPAKKSVTIKLRLKNTLAYGSFDHFDEIFELRKKEADTFYAYLQEGVKSSDLRAIQRQAYAGMVWSKQYYYYHVDQWLKGDPATGKPPENRWQGRNGRWRHLYNSNIISMPDKWEYPWYAAWDLAFHCVPLARLDPSFAKRQLLLMLREYYMHPNGQIPAYEWNFSDVNPPVHAWGAWKVYLIEKEMTGKADIDFLATIFHKLLMNFTWWVNQKDSEGNNLFEGGFLGLDNIGVFDRSHSLPTGGRMEQADGTAWMAMYALNMLRIALEISQVRPHYQEMASKFFEHFLGISAAMFNIGKEHVDLWDDEDEFYYDVIHPENQPGSRLKVRSIVGVIPLFAVEVLKPEYLKTLPDFTRRLQWVLNNRPDLGRLISRWYEHGKGETRMLSLVRIHRLKRILKRLLDETEFLADYGVRALSRYHKEHPYHYKLNDETYSVSYVSGESDSSLFGGNSNWRGPIWFPINFLLLESLHKFHEYYGDDIKMEFPTGSGKELPLNEIAKEIGLRLVKLFELKKDGSRVYQDEKDKLWKSPNFKNHILYYEYFDGDSGRGLGASHQTGWTGLIAEIINLYAK